MNQVSETNQQQEPDAVACEVATAGKSVRRVRPVWKVQDDGATATLRAAVPGVVREDLSISAKDRLVTIEATRRDEAEESPTVYELKLHLSRDLDPESTAAELKDGVLKLRFARKEEARPRTIPVAG